MLDGEPPHIAAAFRLRLITAQRGGEVHGMRWEDVDLDGRWWTIPGSVAKNGLAHRVPLSDLAMDVLVGLRERQTIKMAASPYVLSAAARDPRRRRPTLARLGLSDFRGHDLRRTAASRMASAGCPRLVIGKVLNHAEPGVTAVYDRHTYDAEKREALQTWARSLRALLDADSAGGDRGSKNLLDASGWEPLLAARFEEERGHSAEAREAYEQAGTAADVRRILREQAEWEEAAVLDGEDADLEWLLEVDRLAAARPAGLGWRLYEQERRRLAATLEKMRDDDSAGA